MYCIVALSGPSKQSQQSERRRHRKKKGKEKYKYEFVFVAAKKCSKKSMLYTRTLYSERKIMRMRNKCAVNVLNNNTNTHNRLSPLSRSLVSRSDSFFYRQPAEHANILIFFYSHRSSMYISLARVIKRKLIKTKRARTREAEWEKVRVRDEKATVKINIFFPR